MLNTLNISLLNPAIRLTINVLIYTIIYLLMSPTVLAMEPDREVIKNAFESSNEQEIQRILEQLRDLRDPTRIEQIHTLIEEYRIRYNMPMDMLQGTNTLTIANSDIIKQIVNYSMNIVDLTPDSRFSNVYYYNKVGVHFIRSITTYAHPGLFNPKHFKENFDKFTCNNATGRYKDDLIKYHYLRMVFFTYAKETSKLYKGLISKIEKDYNFYAFNVEICKLGERILLNSNIFKLNDKTRLSLIDPIQSTIVNFNMPKFTEPKRRL